MKRFARSVLVFAVGALVGALVADRNPRRPPTPAALRQPFHIHAEDQKGVYLVPYSLSVDGRTQYYGAKGEGRMWLVLFDGARVQIAATEEPDPLWKP